MTIKKAALATMALSMLMSSTAMAGTWKAGAGENQGKWWYDNENGTYANNGWQWIDGNGDGIAECYYFDTEGWLLTNTTTPEGYQVNSDGAWTVNGVVETQQQTQNTNAGNIANTSDLSSYKGTYKYAGISSFILNEDSGKYELFASSPTASTSDYFTICPYEYVWTDENIEVLSCTGKSIETKYVNSIFPSTYLNDGDKWIYDSNNDGVIQESEKIWYITLESDGRYAEHYIFEKLNVDTGYGWPIGATIMMVSYFEPIR